MRLGRLLIILAILLLVGLAVAYVFVYRFVIKPATTKTINSINTYSTPGRSGLCCPGGVQRDYFGCRYAYQIAVATKLAGARNGKSL